MLLFEEITKDSLNLIAKSLRDCADSINVDAIRETQQATNKFARKKNIDWPDGFVLHAWVRYQNMLVSAAGGEVLTDKDMEKMLSSMVLPATMVDVTTLKRWLDDVKGGIVDLFDDFEDTDLAYLKADAESSFASYSYSFLYDLSTTYMRWSTDITKGIEPALLYKKMKTFADNIQAKLMVEAPIEVHRTEDIINKTPIISTASSPELNSSSSDKHLSPSIRSGHSHYTLHLILLVQRMYVLLIL